jgi:hypothetical protein
MVSWNVTFVFSLSPPINFLISDIFSKTGPKLLEYKMFYFALVGRKTVVLLNERKACNFTGINNIVLRGFD